MLLKPNPPSAQDLKDTIAVLRERNEELTNERNAFSRLLTACRDGRAATDRSRRQTIDCLTVERNRLAKELAEAEDPSTWSKERRKAVFNRLWAMDTADAWKGMLKGGIFPHGAGETTRKVTPADTVKHTAQVQATDHTVRYLRIDGTDPRILVREDDLKELKTRVDRLLID